MEITQTIRQKYKNPKYKNFFCKITQTTRQRCTMLDITIKSISVKTQITGQKYKDL